MRHFVLFVAILVATVSMASATTNSEKYNRANKLYAEGSTLEALRLYNSIDSVNPDLEYNRALAYFKLGRLGKAVVHFNRALKLRPYDSDTIANLEYIQSVKKDKEKLKEPGYLHKLIGSVSLTTMTWVAIGLYLLTALCVVGRILAFETSAKRKLTVAITLTATVTLLWGAATGASIYQFERDDRAVAVAGEVNAYSGPKENAEKVFTFHEGTEVDIRRIQGEYAMVTLSSGLSGWAKLSKLERI